MNVLVITSQTPDYLSSCLWDGFQEILGEAQVVDGVGCPYLHKSTMKAIVQAYHGPDHGLGGPAILQALSGTREGCWLSSEGRPRDGFDLLLLHSCVNRDYDAAWCQRWLAFKKPEGKVVYLEGWDEASHIVPPPFPVDAVFRKEIDPALVYPYRAQPLTFGAPRRWLHREPDSPRPLDLFWSGNPDACHPAHPVRRPMLQQVFRTQRTHHSVVATYGLGLSEYFHLLRKAKLALCPVGADDTDSLRTMEAVACGAIPVFVGYPPRIRDPWFPGSMSFSCSVETLPEHLDEALSQDLSGKRRALLAHVAEYHTTAARARRVLEVLGMTL